MADSKTSYSTNASKAKEIAKYNKALGKKLQGGKKRAEKYISNWEAINLNDLVKKIAPGAKPYELGGKIVFSNGGRYIIITDVAGGYCRIQDLYNHSSNPYVTLNFQSFDNLPTHDRQRLTHFKIKKREEM